MKKRNSADGADTFERDREKERCRAEIIESSNSRKREKREKRQKREREGTKRENTSGRGYRQRRHNNQEYDNTRDGCLPSPQSSARRMPRNRRG